MNKEEMKAELKKLIDEVKKRTYLPEYQDGVSDEQVLGVIVSTYVGWDGKSIMEVVSSALEDANYHMLNAKIQSVYEDD